MVTYIKSLNKNPVMWDFPKSRGTFFWGSL